MGARRVERDAIFMSKRAVNGAITPASLKGARTGCQAQDAKGHLPCAGFCGSFDIDKHLFSDRKCIASVPKCYLTDKTVLASR
jgi:hypothetical protein